MQLKYGMLGKAGLELQSILNFTQDKIDLEYCLSSHVVVSRQHLEIYEDKFVDARGISDRRNEMQM